MDSNIERAMGRVEAKQEAQDQRLSNIEKAVSSLHAKIDAVITSKERQRGARSAIKGMITLAGGGLGAAIFKYWTG